MLFSEFGVLQNQLNFLKFNPFSDFQNGCFIKSPACGPKIILRFAKQIQFLKSGRLPFQNQPFANKILTAADNRFCFLQNQPRFLKINLFAFFPIRCFVKPIQLFKNQPILCFSKSAFYKITCLRPKNHFTFCKTNPTFKNQAVAFLLIRYFKKSIQLIKNQPVYSLKIILCFAKSPRIIKINFLNSHFHSRKSFRGNGP